MRIFLLIICLLSVSTSASAQDIREKVKAGKDKALLSNIIDPDNSILGVAVGTLEDDFIKKIGKPDGFIRLSANESCMIYGKDKAFLFEDGKLHGVLISENILDWKLTNRMVLSGASGQVAWELNNGIKSGMNLADVNKILGPQSSANRYRRTYSTETATVQLSFAHYRTEGDTESAYRLTGVTVQKKSLSNPYGTIRYSSAETAKRLEKRIKEAEETIKTAKLIIYCKSSIVGGKHITKFERVLWSDPDRNHKFKQGEVLSTKKVEPNCRYGDAQIMFYGGEDDSYKAAWAVYSGRIPAWGDKNFEEFADRLKSK